LEVKISKVGGRMMKEAFLYIPDDVEKGRPHKLGPSCEFV
jgi:hypothetical protein